MDEFPTDDLIELRPLTIDDAAEHLAGEDEAWERWLSGGPGTIEGVARAIERWVEQWKTGGPVRNFGIRERATERLLGNLELNLSGTLDGVAGDEANVSYGTFSFARGRGVASRAVRLACDYLELHHPSIEAVVIRCEPGNEASIRVAERAGFRPDGEVPGDRGTPMLRFVRELHSKRRAALRATFGADAERYDRWRPSYPAAIFEDIAALAGLQDHVIGLEVGCGTGQATAALRRLVDELHVVELSHELLKLARRRVTDPGITWHHGTFEKLDLPNSSLDLVAAATSFHWVDPAVRYQHTARLLRPGGALAIVHTHHLSGGTPGFFEASRPAYMHAFGEDPEYVLPDVADVSRECAELVASGYFDQPQVRVHAVEEQFTAEAYVGLLGTFSPVIALPDETRNSFLAELGRVVDDDFGGRVARRYAYSLVVARAL